MARASELRASWVDELLGRVEEAPLVERLDGLTTEAVQPLLSALGDRWKDLLHGRFLGHALHPVLSDLPIGFWTASVLADVLGMERTAGVMSAAGVAAAVPTALSGATDWSTTYGRDRRLGVVHGLLNTAGLGLQAMSLVSRIGGRSRAARTLSMAGWAVSGLSAYLGGELTFGRGVMVDHTAWITGPAEWTPVLPEAELADRTVQRVEVDGRGVLLYREAGEIHALEDTCTHAGCSLSGGEVESGVVTCPCHGSRFCLADGSVVRSPATHPQPRLMVRIHNGTIEVRGPDES
jgi:nitrite reductase/ring-hydroxylating ferredoxin subunit/uncharacterized membrane protein